MLNWLKELLASIFGLYTKNEYAALQKYLVAARVESDKLQIELNAANDKINKLQTELDKFKENKARLTIIHQDGVTFTVNGEPASGSIYLDKGTEITLAGYKDGKLLDQISVDEKC